MRNIVKIISATISVLAILSLFGFFHVTLADPTPPTAQVQTSQPSLFQKIGNFISGIENGVTSFVVDLFGGIGNGIGDLFSKIKNFFSPNQSQTDTSANTGAPTPAPKSRSPKDAGPGACNITQTTTFDPNHRFTFLDSIGVLNHAVNMKWTAPQGPLGATWINNGENCQQFSGSSSAGANAGVTSGYVLPTANSSFINHDSVIKHYDISADYQWYPTDWASQGLPPPPDGVGPPPTCEDGTDNCLLGAISSSPAICNGIKCDCGGGTGFTCSIGTTYPIPEQNTVGYVTSVNVPALSSVSFSSDPAKQIAAEDEIINNIQKNGTIDIKATTPGLDDYTFHVPATNCVHLSGNGPRKVVFERGDSLQGGVADFLSKSTDIINNGFDSIDPFKTYINQFSFYADLEQVDQSKLVDENNHFASGKPVVTASNCGQDASEYLFVFENNSYAPAWTDTVTNPPVVFLNIPVILKLSLDPNFNTVSNIVPTATIHETGHALGRLHDEYIYAKMGSPFNGFDLIGDLNDTGMAEENCTLNPASLYTYDDGTGLKWYGDSNRQGCSFALHPSDYSLYYRPSNASIMNSGSHSTQFNVISCGYLISAIKGEPVDKAHAQTHWPECMTLDTVKPVTPTKIITVGGIGTSINGPFSGIFPWMDKIAPGSIRIPSGLHSIAYLTKQLRQTINDQLAGGNKVLVIGHSIGAFIAFNIHKEFTGKNVQFLYIDPPYKILLGKKCFSILGGNFSAVHQAVCDGVAIDPVTGKWNPDSINWTDGAAFGAFFGNLKYHDAFDYENYTGIAPDGKKNAQNLDDLKSIIQNRLATDCSGSCSFSTVPSTGSLGQAPTITGIMSSNGLPLKSIGPGDTVTIVGHGFNTNANNIEIESTVNPDIYYDIYDDAAPDPENGLTFTLPVNPDTAPATVTGSYTVKVSTVNSDWSNPPPYH